MSRAVRSFGASVRARRVNAATRVPRDLHALEGYSAPLPLGRCLRGRRSIQEGSIERQLKMESGYMYL